MTSRMRRGRGRQKIDSRLLLLSLALARHSFSTLHFLFIPLNERLNCSSKHGELWIGADRGPQRLLMRFIRLNDCKTSIVSSGGRSLATGFNGRGFEKDGAGGCPSAGDGALWTKIKLLRKRKGGHIASSKTV